MPKEAVSVCGTNFVGAISELKELVSELDQDKIQQSTAHRGVKWNFNLPGAPHFGGIHEAMIKSKKAIYGVIGTSDATNKRVNYCSDRGRKSAQFATAYLPVS